MENKIGNKKDVKFAGFWIRHIAISIDVVIIMLFTTPLIYYINQFGIDYTYESAAGIALGFTLDILGFLYFAILHYKWGQTPGKMAVGVKVVDKNFGKLSFLQSLWRSVATILSALPLGLGYLWASWDSKKRTFHDMLSKTYVIEKNAISKGWVIGWNILIAIIGLLIIWALVSLFFYIIGNPEMLREIGYEGGAF